MLVWSSDCQQCDPQEFIVILTFYALNLSSIHKIFPKLYKQDKQANAIYQSLNKLQPQIKGVTKLLTHKSFLNIQTYVIMIISCRVTKVSVIRGCYRIYTRLISCGLSSPDTFIIIFNSLPRCPEVFLVFVLSVITPSAGEDRGLHHVCSVCMLRAS